MEQRIQNKTGQEMTETENTNGEKGVAQKQRGDIIEVKRNNAGWSFWNAHALQPQNGTNGG